ncbi:hypothetical protein [Yoonia maritima]|uniref:hypothetical protein n=1 Tax=Yoonia maritima TaxID=1435347 RepID=UPI001FAF0CBA|nr:hypothetical protein [Yoonia maritima]
MTPRQGKLKTVPMGIWIAAAVALAFGALTILSGGSALFGPSAMRVAVGDAVPFVLWFNFLSGFAYMAVGLGIALRMVWANLAAIALAVAIVVVFALLGWHILQGNPYEMRTVGAMVLRAGIWIAIALYLRAVTSKQYLKP